MQGIETAIGSITNWGRSEKARGEPALKRRVFGQFALVYLIGGEGFYEDDNGCHQNIAAGDLVTVFPKLGHRYGPGREDHWIEYFIVFEGPMFDLWEREGLLDASRPIVRLLPISHWRQRFERVLPQGPYVTEAGALQCVCRFQQLLATISSLVNHDSRGGTDSLWLTRACELLEQTDGQAVDMAVIADQMNCSHDHFRRKFSVLMGRTPKRYRDGRLAARACELVQGGRLSNKQIAAQLGFADEFYFSRRFKQLVGCSPRAYRRSLP